jgi:hypothetical protein
MCMEDIILGRKTGVAEQRVTLQAGVAVQAIPANKNRIALIIGPQGAGTVANSMITLGFDNTVIPAQGMNLSGITTPLVLNIKDHGDIVRRPLWVVSTVLSFFTFWEVTLLDGSVDNI